MKKKTKQKLITLSLEREINKFKKHLQIQENIKFGRKAKNVSFIEATANPKNLALFILNGGLK